MRAPRSLTSSSSIRARLRELADPKHRTALEWFFKTGKGEYGEGDRFIGVRVPRIRALLRELGKVEVRTLAELLRSPVHEERLFALIGLVQHFARADEPERAAIYRLYLASTRRIDNWDLVDVSAPDVVGVWLADRSRAPLYRLARSKSVWERRIAILATFHFIKRGEARDTLAIAERLLGDPHDLIHKACGWMLREVGKRVSLPALEGFLDKHATRMPRTMLRYAIERLPVRARRRYLALKQ